MNKSIIQKLFPFITILIAALLIVAPLCGPGFIATDDGNWMIIRLSAFYQSFHDGQFPVRFLGRLNHEYGYPVANFLYPGFMYAGSVIHAFGIPFVDTVKLLIGFSVICSAMFVYLWLRTFFQKTAALVGAMAFIFSPYLAFDIYKRGSIGELFSFPWIAITLWAIEKGQKKIFTLGVALLIISHNSIALMAMVFIGVYLIATRRFLLHVPWLALSFGLSAFFWVPAIHERKYVVFDERQVSRPADYFVTATWIWLVGIPGLFALLLSWSRNVKSSLKNIFGFVYVASVFLALPISNWLWNMPFFIKLFQFPFRFFTLSIFLGAWFIALVLNKETKKRSALIAVFFTGFLIQFILGRTLVVRERHPEEFYTTNEATTTVQDEYMPKWVSQKPTERPRSAVEFYSGNGFIRPQNYSLQTIDVEVESQSESIIQINTMYYPGWGVTVSDTRALVDYKNPLGVMRVAVPAGTHRVIAEFRETVSRFLADLVSLISFVIFFIYVIYQRKRARRSHR